MAQRVYLDYGATTPVCSEARNAFADAMTLVGNPSSMHAFGRAAKELLETSRETVAEFVGAQPGQVVFTGSGTESNNQVLKSLIYRVQMGEPCHVVTSAIEHPSVWRTCDFLTHFGIEVTRVPVGDSGVVSAEAVASAITPHTRLVSVMAVNNEVGTIQPVSEIGALCREREVLFHVDAVQAAGKIPVNLAEWQADFITLSGHKLYAPKGVGVLVLRDDESVVPLVHGGTQERRLRAGTQNVAGAAALAAAIRVVASEMDQDQAAFRALRDRLVTQLTQRPISGVVNGALDQAVPSILNISFPGISAQSMMMNLDLDGIAVSTGSACSTGSPEPSTVLTAMGVSQDRIDSGIRVSFGRGIGQSEIDAACRSIGEIVKRMRR